MDEYRLDVYNSAGNLERQVYDFLGLWAELRCSDYGLLRLDLNGEHPAVGLLQHRRAVEVWRRNRAVGLEWRCEGAFLVTGRQRMAVNGWVRLEYQPGGSERIERMRVWCAGPAWLLATRVVGWPWGTANRSAFSSVAPETIAKTLVEYNLGASATVAAGRIAAGVVPGVTVATDQERGAALNWICTGESLLLTLQRLARAAGADLGFTRSGAGWVFEWYPGQLGTDRSTDVIFSLAHGNMAEPVYDYLREDGKSLALAAGQDAGGAWLYRASQGTDYAAGQVDSESWITLSGDVDNGALDAAGAAEVEKRRAVEVVNFQVLQTPGVFYGKHYELGDLVKVRYGDIELTQKVVGVVMEAGSGIAITMK